MASSSSRRLPTSETEDDGEGQLSGAGDGDGEEEQVEMCVYVRAIADYKAQEPGELSFLKGDIIEVYSQDELGWCDGMVEGERGWFPPVHVVPLTEEEYETERAFSDQRDLMEMMKQVDGTPIHDQDIQAIFKHIGEAIPEDGIPGLTDVVRLESEPDVIEGKGEFGEIRRGRLFTGNLIVLKTLVLQLTKPTGPLEETAERYYTEMRLWLKMRHPNILPFLGVADVPGKKCLVWPWMENRNCVEFLKAIRDAPRMPIIQGVARGLAYLHSREPPMIHGDLKGTNVLITAYGEPMLADYSIPGIVEDLTQLPISEAIYEKNPRWMAPELFTVPSRVSLASDVWSYGMVVLEIMTLEQPFADLRTSNLVLHALRSAIRPRRPTSSASNGLSDGPLWNLCIRCWSQNPKDRPTAKALVDHVDG